MLHCRMEKCLKNKKKQFVVELHFLIISRRRKKMGSSQETFRRMYITEKFIESVNLPL